MLVAAACGSVAPAPPLQLGAASQTYGSGAASPTPAATGVSNLASAAPGTANGAADAAAAPANSASGPVTIALSSSDATAQYQTQEQLAGHNLPTLAVGKTTAVTGSIVLANGQLAATASKITVDLSTLASDQSMRDNFIRGNTLQTSKYPDAVFVATQVSGLPATLPTSGSAAFQLTGDLTVHGVTKPATWTVTATFNGSQVSGKATAPFTITEFGMNLPKAGPVLSVQDSGTLELDFADAAISAAS